MIAPLNHPLPTDAAAPPRIDDASPAQSARVDLLRAPVAAFCAALAFFCFLPYPALSVGSNSALQAGNVFVLLLAIPAVLVSWKRRPFWVFPLLLAPLCIATLKAAVVGSDHLDVCLKGLVVWALSLMTILAAQLCAPRYALQMLTGIAAATLLHAAVGLYQFYRFQTGGDFPLAELYVNPSFLSVQDNATIIARYVQRPFGLFPEPSAMAASLAPWVLVLLALSFNLLRLRDVTAPPSPGTPGEGRGEGSLSGDRQKTLTPTLSRSTGRGGIDTTHRLFFGAAALAGLGLIIVSRSGHAAPTCLAVVLLVATWFARARATFRTFGAVAVVFGLFLPAVVYLAANSVGERLGGKTAFGNSSWGERADSLVTGFNLVADSDLATHLFGMGVGLMSPALKDSAGLDAVFSVLLTYVFETGVLGALAVACVAYLLLRSWIATRFDLTFALVFGVWLVGITVITSYDQLLPIWLTLGFLTVWPEVFASRRGANGYDDESTPGRPHPAPEGRKNLAHGASRGTQTATHFSLLLSQPRRGVRIVHRAATSGARCILAFLTPLRGWGNRGEGNCVPFGLRRGLSSFAPPGLVQTGGAT